MEEMKSLTFQTGNEPAVVTLSSGQRGIVSGGIRGISFSSGEVMTLYGNSHPYDCLSTGPSIEDYQALNYLNQRSSYLLEHGKLTKFLKSDVIICPF